MGGGRGFAPCGHENSCAEGTLECGREAAALDLDPTGPRARLVIWVKGRKRQLRDRTPKRFARFPPVVRRQRPEVLRETAPGTGVWTH